jgi:hypothetical protein
MYNPKDKMNYSMRDMFESMPLQQFIDTITDLTEGVDGKPPEMKPEDFSIADIYESVGPSTFPIVTGTLISKKVMDAYELESKNLARLTTPFNSNLEIDKIPGMYHDGELQTIKPGGPYPHTGDIKEKYVTVAGEKRGEILDITEESRKFDQTGLIMMRAAQYGERAAQDEEKRGMLTIQDVAYQGVNYYAWYPSGTRVAIYSTSTTAPHSQSNQVTNALADHTDLDAANKLLRLMKSDNGKDPINVMAKQMLVPVALEVTGKRLIMNEVLVGGTNNEKNPFANAVEVIASPWLDVNSSITWYWGDFKKQFVKKIVFPLQVMVKDMSNNQDGFERDIIASYKVRHYTQVAATDFRFVVKSTGAS